MSTKSKVVYHFFKSVQENPLICFKTWHFISCTTTTWYMLWWQSYNKGKVTQENAIIHVKNLVISFLDGTCSRGGGNVCIVIQTLWKEVSVLYVWVAKCALWEVSVCCMLELRRCALACDAKLAQPWWLPMDNARRARFAWENGRKPKKEHPEPP